MFENRLPLAGFDSVNLIDKTTTITIKIASRKAKISDNIENNPTIDNAWRYIIHGSVNEDNDQVLETNIGPIINVKRGTKLNIHWVNTLDPQQANTAMTGIDKPPNPMSGPVLQAPPINPLPMNYPIEGMEGMNGSVGVVTHLHGAKVQPAADGWPLWPISFAGNPYLTDSDPANPGHLTPFPTARTYSYPNDQRAAMLWFHDHAMDNTGPQVHAGLAGLYFIRDESDDKIFDLIGGQLQDGESMELPLVIQDRNIDCDFCCVDYWAGIPSHFAYDADHKITSLQLERSEFLGETILVNGRPWPHHELTQKIYRLRVLNGSNARTYALALLNPHPGIGMAEISNKKIWYNELLTVIGNDGGLFPKSQPLGSDSDYILLAPGERLDFLLDLTGICPDDVPKLRLVNLAVNSLHSDDWPEGIFQTEDASIYKNSNTDPDSENQRKAWLAGLLSIKQANIMQFCIKHLDDVCNCDCTQSHPPRNNPLYAALDAYLEIYAQTDDEFKWQDNCAGDIEVQTVNDITQNRLVLLMNNTTQSTGTNDYVYDGKWHDTQIWEMGSVPNDLPNNINNVAIKPFALPFYVDLVNQVRGENSPSQHYMVSRSTFFDPVDEFKAINESPVKQYSNLAAATFKVTSGSYERWYVANIGNQDPSSTATSGIPDMHPFHIHLVNFVVLRRFVLDETTHEFKLTDHPNTYDCQVRHDTVRIQSNELVELLVHFPKGYTGNYPYHCHLVEHEDMGMMLHFEIS